MKPAFLKFFLPLLTVAALLLSVPAQAVSFNMQAVGGTAGGQYVARSGTTYTADANGVVTAVDQNDVIDLLKSGLYIQDISPPFNADIFGNPHVFVKVGTATIANVNAGTTLLTGVTGRTIYVTNLTTKAVGTLATCTGVIFRDSASSPVNAVSFLSAGALSGTGDLSWNSATATVGAAMGSAGLTASKGLVLVKSGSDCATATGIRYAVTYVLQ